MKVDGIEINPKNTHKKCSLCHIFKLIVEFHKDRNKIDGHSGRCKSCAIQSAREFGQKYHQINQNIQYNNTDKKFCPQCNQIKKINDFHKNTYQKDGLSTCCKSCTAQYDRQYYKKNKTKKTKQSADWKRNNPQRQKDLHKRWRENNPEKIKIWNEKSTIARKNNPRNRLSCQVSAGIRRSIRNEKANRHWESLVGYTINDLMRHLESQFQQGMCWDNCGKWHLDHRRPISSFHFISPDNEQFKQCWSLNNLQPLWAVDNLSKGSKILCT